MSLGPAINFNDVSVRYADQPVIEQASFSMPAGSFYYLTGASGSGKTSLIKLIYGDIHPYTGSIKVLNYDLNAIKRSEISLLRRQIGIVFQEFNLINDLSIIDNVALPLRVQGAGSRYSRNRAKEILNWLGFEESFDALPSALSGGQKQRIVLARAIINEPRIILADEATGNLDDDNAIHLVEVFRELNNRGTTILFATHNLGLIRCYPQPVLQIHNKSVLFQPEKIIHPSQDNIYDRAI